MDEWKYKTTLGMGKRERWETWAELEYLIREKDDSSSMREMESEKGEKHGNMRKMGI